MNFLHQLRIGARLGLAFAFVLALTVAITALSLNAMATLNEHAEQIVAVEYRKVKLETTALDNARGSIARVLQLTGDPDGQRRGEARERLKANVKAFDDALAALDPLLTRPEGQALFKEAQRHATAYKATLVQVQAQLAAEEAGEAVRLAYTTAYPAMHRLSAALRALLDYNQKVLEETGADSARHHTAARQAALALGLAALCAGALCAWWVTRSITRRLAVAVDLANRVAQGDLSAHIDSHGRDEVALLLQALARMNDNLRQLVTQVRDAADSIATGSAEIAVGNADLSRRTEAQASNLQQTAASMEQLTATVKHNADAAREATTLAQGAAGVAADGGRVVHDVVGTMEQISASSRRIADIIGVIDGIAFQTNILSLNAAVEAARAGEQGRGFAVVAGEVRSLAQRSAHAAREIKQLIGESVETVGAGSRLAGDAGSTMSNIVTQVQRVNTLIAEISHASAEQSSGIEQVGRAVGQLDEVTQQNAALVEQSAAAAESLKAQAARLAQTVATFKIAPG